MATGSRHAQSVRQVPQILFSTANGHHSMGQAIRKPPDSEPQGDPHLGGASESTSAPACSTRVVLLISSDRGCDVAGLVRQLEAAHGGNTTVTLESVEDASASRLRDRAPIGDARAETLPNLMPLPSLRRPRKRMAHRPALHFRPRRKHPWRQVDRCGTADDGATSIFGPVADPISVVIASDRLGLLGALLRRWEQEPDIKVLGDPITDPAQLLDGLGQRRPMQLWLDKPMFDRLDPASIDMIQAKAPGVRVLLLCDDLGAGLVAAVLRHRFHGLLVANGAPAESVEAMRAVDRGELWLARHLLAQALFRQSTAAPAAVEPSQAPWPQCAAQDALTDREAQVVTRLRRGLSNKEIARELGIMEDTVKKHLQNVFAKVGVRRRALLALRPTERSSSD